MNKTSIEWTDFTWNPIRARRKPLSDGRVLTGTFCTRISPGCQHCYASVINQRFGTGAEYTVPNLAEHEFYIDEKILAEPLRRKKPARIFVGDMFDLFHEAIPDELIERVFRVMALNRDHTYQVLTKRAARMQSWLSVFWRGKRPMEHIWLGVSVEDQQRADERIPLLLQAPAAVRFLSIEPLLGKIDLSNLISIPDADRSCSICGCHHEPESESLWTEHICPPGFGDHRINWVIVGGESGLHARPFDIAWAESVREQCRTAGVRFFFKQDSGRFPGMPGRASEELWSTKEFPR